MRDESMAQNFAEHRDLPSDTSLSGAIKVICRGSKRQVQEEQPVSRDSQLHTMITFSFPYYAFLSLPPLFLIRQELNLVHSKNLLS